MRPAGRALRYRLGFAVLAVAILVPLSVAAASGHHKRVVPLPHFRPVTKVVKIKHKRWLVLRSLTISHLGHIRPLVECGGCLREAGPIHTSKLRRGTITYSGVNWLLRGRYAARIIVYRKGAIGRMLSLRAKLGKHPGLVFERAACLKSSRKTVRCPRRTVTPTAGTPVTAPVDTTTPAATPAIGTPSATATASGNTITFSGSVNANGNAIAVTVTDTTDGTSHVCGNGTGLVQCTWVEAGLKYKTVYYYTLTATDTSGSGRATVSAQTSATTSATPPPIQTPTLSGTVSGNSISVSGSVDDGGLAASAVLRDNTDGATGSCTTSGSIISCTLNEASLSYSTNYSYTLTATDASSYGRASTVTSWSGTTGPPPSGTPSVSVARGTAAPTSKCGGASSCYYIQTTTANFPAGVTCQITASTYGLAGFVTWTQGANATSNGPDAQENKSVTVQCSGGGVTASGTGNW
jgi:hypothetical protein